MILNEKKPLDLAHRIGFLEGAIEGITLYSIWSNGEQLVGCMRKPLKEVLKPYKEELETLKGISQE